MAHQHQERQPPARPPPPAASAVRRASNTSPTPVPTVIQSFRDFQRVHDAAYKLVNAGLAADERGDTESASEQYNQGSELLDRCLRCELEHSRMGSHMKQAQEMQAKLNKTRQQVIYRLRDHQSRHQSPLSSPSQPTSGAFAMPELNTPQSPMGACALPSYEEAISIPSSATMPPSYDEDELTALGESLMLAESGTAAPPSTATEILHIPDGVQIFFIAPNGLVSAPSYPAALHVVTFDREHEGAAQHEAPPAFLYVGDWVYPLIPGTSPSLHTTYGAYIFPDVTAAQPGSAVGLMLPNENAGVRQQFEEIINSFTIMGSEVTQPQHLQQPEAATEAKHVEGEEEKESNDTAAKISKGILVAADWITWGMGKGAEKAGELLKAGSERYRRGSKPTESQKEIDPKVQQGVMYARKATSSAVKVTGYIVNKLGAATMVLAKQLAPHVRHHGEKIVPKSMKNDDGTGKSKLDGVVKVAASGLQGFGTVFMGLEAAAKSLGRSLTQETVQVVKHKYGEQAGALTENTMYTAGNFALAAYNVDSMGAKAIAKRTAKETGKAVINDLNTPGEARSRSKSPNHGGGDLVRKQ